MTEAAVAIRTEGLGKRFGPVPALTSVNLRVEVGEVFGLLGPNGAGKSTLIRILLDLLRPSSGGATVLGRAPRSGTQMRRRIGYLPGDFVIYDRQTAAEALTTLGRLRGGVDRRRIAGLADRLGLDLRRTVRELSKGNRQKVGLVQAFMHEPELLILDEPTSGLDPLLRQQFVEMVDEVHADGRTVFLSSHILSEVQATAARVAMLRAGRLVSVDTVDSLRERAVRRVLIQFEGVVAESEFTGLPHVTDAIVASEAGFTVLRCRLGGVADALVKAAARHRVHSLLVEEPDLEEVFLTLYDDDRRA